MDEQPEDDFLDEKPTDPRFTTLLDKEFAIFICERISRETGILFEYLFNHEHLLEYIEAIRQHNSSITPIESMTTYINTRKEMYNHENELYVMITGLPVSEKTLQHQHSLIVGDFHRLREMKCRNDYDRRIASMNLKNFVDW